MSPAAQARGSLLLRANTSVDSVSTGCAGCKTSLFLDELTRRRDETMMIPRGLGEEGGWGRGPVASLSDVVRVRHNRDGYNNHEYNHPF